MPAAIKGRKDLKEVTILETEHDTEAQSLLSARMEDRILLLTIDNPPDNRLPARIFSELHDRLESARSETVDAVVFTGKGRSFSKGADLSEFTERKTQLDNDLLMFGNELFETISQLGKPAIAAINGACFGGGLELSLACHIRVCSEKARLGLPELSLGLIPGLGGIERLTQVVGRAKALELILMGDIIPAAKALEIDLVSRVFPKKGFMEHVLRFVQAMLYTRKEAIKELLDLFAMSLPENEQQNVQAAAKSFLRLFSKGTS